MRDRKDLPFMQKMHLQSIKQLNRNRVFRLIAERNRVSKQEIATALGLSLPTTTQNLNSLKEEGLIVENGTLSSGIGRKARAVSIVPDFKVAIGLDLTPHHISMVLADMTGSIIDYVREKFEICSSEECYIKLANKVKDFILKNDINLKQILGMGLMVPGIIAFDQKTIVEASTMPVPKNFCEIMEKFFEFPCDLFNDASSAGFAEFWKNDYKDKVIAYLMLSNTVGGAILIDGIPYSGMENRSAEFGHVTLTPGMGDCVCGHKGCSEVYCSALRLAEHADNSLELFFRKLEEGNEECLGLMDTYLENLSILINDINMCLDCSVVLGGYMGPYLKNYIPRLRQMAAERSTFPTDGLYIKPCTCEFEAAALGGALFYIDEFVKNI